MSEQAELAFVKNYVNILSAQPVTFANDHQVPPEESLKKVPVLQVDVPPPPERKAGTAVSAAAITITFKSLKPPQSYTLSIQPTDTISAIKSQLASEPGAPPAEVQRLLLKGKALADNKLLQEYGIKDGDTVNLVVKPGYSWDPKAVPIARTSSPAGNAASLQPSQSEENVTLTPELPKSKRSHSRVPSVVLSPSPSLTATTNEKIVDIPLLLDASSIPTSLSATGHADSPYHSRLSQPAFWSRLHEFLSGEFPNHGDAERAWEDFFCVSKGNLSVSEIAKIRDKVGFTGMAGT
ncbi:hypothetical protein NLI96_g9317 [Meripilus lineatus]|uniref:Ubiquitin-like domain-containing protein n=1 Tax=Meripilus lineatus TaxID=2056292 RepID=A0AAD5UXB2_9APHY|nr:hypothetical protein NLI96_g9317 [Physisporinus lineatus]